MIDIKDVKKVSKKVNKIDGWKVKSLRSWESKYGDDMITIRLSKDPNPPKPAPVPPRPERPRLRSKPPVQAIKYVLDEYKESMKEKKIATKLISKVKKRVKKEEEKDDKPYKLG